MPTHRTNHRVGHSAQAMYELVSDVEKYPAFVPLCEALSIRARKQGDTHSRTLPATKQAACSKQQP